METKPREFVRESEEAVAGDVFESMDEFLNEKQEAFARIEGFTPGKFIRIGSLTAGDLIEWTEANEGEAKRTAGLRLITKSIVDSNGNRIGTVRDIPKLREKSHAITERIVRGILKLNGMRVKGEEIKND